MLNLSVMIIAILSVLGLCLGSFVNALVWRLHEQSKLKKKRVASDKELSISRGRSMCPHCQHTLTWYDLIPVLSWLSVRGKCRYCRKPISVQYPLVELATAALFVVSYLFWPLALHGLEIGVFAVWLMVLTGLIALLVYDARWYLLPNRIIYPLTAIAGLGAALRLAESHHLLVSGLNLVAAVGVGGGLFYGLFQISRGKWIGGGDVKLGWLLGLVVANPGGSFLFIFIAALLGTFASLPLLISKRLKATSVIPFGPFLIIAAIIAQLFGTSILLWYKKMFLPYNL